MYIFVHVLRCLGQISVFDRLSCQEMCVGEIPGRDGATANGKKLRRDIKHYTERT